MSNRLILIGYWASPATPTFPDPVSLIHSEWDRQEREDVADYLKRGLVARAYLGGSSCRLCNEAVGSLELSDGTYLWPEGLAHYVEVHGVRPPAQFVRHIHDQTSRLEEAVVDDGWWRSQVGPEKADGLQGEGR